MIIKARIKMVWYWLLFANIIRKYEHTNRATVIIIKTNALSQLLTNHNSYKWMKFATGQLNCPPDAENTYNRSLSHSLNLPLSLTVREQLKTLAAKLKAHKVRICKCFQVKTRRESRDEECK